MSDGVSRALVLGGGGVCGIAWLTGLLLGFEEAGLDPHEVDLVLGTSAGAAFGGPLEREISELEATGSRVMAVVPDAAARTAFGRNPLDPAHRPASAKAGLEQGRHLAPAVLAFWK